MPDLYRSPAGERAVRAWCRDRLVAWPTPHEVETLSTSAGDTHLTTLGTGPACLYLPGTNFNAATSTALLDALGQSFRVVCADLPGQPGLSAAGRPADETAGYARWVGEVLAHVSGIAPEVPPVLVGHSRGAAVALSADPEAVQGLLLLSPAGLARVRVTPAVLVRSIAWLVRPSTRRSRRLVDLMAGRTGGSDGLEPVTDWMTLVARRTRTTGAPGPLPAGVLDRWRGRRVRVLVGGHDVFFPPARIAGPAREHLGAAVEVVDAAGHLLVDQEPALVAQHARWLAGPG